MAMAKLYAIWCNDENKNKGDWLRELPSNVDDGGEALLVFPSKQSACNRAAKHYGYDTYSEARRDDWCEVRCLLT